MHEPHRPRRPNCVEIKTGSGHGALGRNQLTTSRARPLDRSKQNAYSHIAISARNEHYSI